MDIGDTVYVSTPGTLLRLEGDALRVHLPDVPGRHLVPLHRVEALVLWNGVDISADTLHWCLDHGVHVSWITQNGRLHASLTGQEPGRPELRLAQYRSYSDVDDRLDLARRFIAGKLQNYRQLLLRAARDSTGTKQRRLREIAHAHAQGTTQVGEAGNLTEMLGIEGRAARDYFGSLDLVIDQAVPSRSRRPPTDPVNCYLSATYGLLRTAVQSAIVHVGLDPHVGFLHGVRGPNPSLALDLMEEMRPLLVDRLVATLFNRREVRNSHWRQVPGGGVLLTDAGWKHLLDAWVHSRQRTWVHAPLGRQVTAAEIPFIQARWLARRLREPDYSYEPWRIA